MHPYSIQFSFTKEQLTMFYAAKAWVAIGKPLEGDSPSLAWLTFQPFEHNQVEWEEQYGIYASLDGASGNDPMTQGSQSEFPASAGNLYALQPQGSFGPPSAEEGLDPASYYAVNSFAGAPAVTFGLFQKAQVDGQKPFARPLSAEVTPSAFRARMTPATTVYIWIQSESASVARVGQVSSPPTRVDFASGTFSKVLAFDSSTGTFVPAPAGS